MEIISSSSGPIPPDYSGSASAATPQPGRPDYLTAQKVEVGIILQAMLGTQAAVEYMASNAINHGVAARVLNQPEKRRGRHDQHGVRV
ncbi:hypothetical protein [Massilia sp. PWRC2]|uniref:hypothetical protein n=1 Tax=Massilia sp. PWRC2 TaxID=2804626 RepID=UPI003CEC5FA6